MSYRDGMNSGNNNGNNLMNNRSSFASGMNSDSGNNFGSLGNPMGRYYNNKGSFPFENNDSRMMNDSNSNSSSSAMMAYNNAFNKGLMMSPQRQQQQQQQQQQQYNMYQQYASTLAGAHHGNNSNPSGTNSKSYLNPLMMQYGAAALNVTDAGKEAGPGKTQEENLMIAASVAASGLFLSNDDAKGKKRKKAKDKPKRPLSAYNIFFKDERAKILNKIPDVKKLDSSESKPDAETDSSERKEYDTNEDPSADEKDGSTSNAPATATANRKKKSIAKKKKTPHGKISFESLAKEIGSRWKTLSEESKEEYKKKAQEDTLRYSKEMEAYAKKVAYQASENNSSQSDQLPQRANRKSLDEQELQSVKEAFTSISKAMDKDNTLGLRKHDMIQDDLEKEMPSAFKRQRMYNHYDQSPAAMIAASYSQQHQQQFQQQMDSLIPQYTPSGTSSLGQQQSSQQNFMGSSNTGFSLSQYNQLMMGGGHDHGSGPSQQQHQMQQQLLLQQQQQLQQQMQSVANWQNYGFQNNNSNNNNNNNNNIGPY